MMNELKAMNIELNEFFYNLENKTPREMKKIYETFSKEFEEIENEIYETYKDEISYELSNLKEEVVANLESLKEMIDFLGKWL